MSDRTDHWRNEFARCISNFVIKNIATREYSSKVDSLIKQGMFYAEFDDDPPYIGRKDRLKRG